MPTSRLNYALRETVFTELYRKFLPDRVWDAEAVHRSDLIFCLRKAWARYSDLAPEHPERTMMFFLRGRVLHEMLALGDAEHEVVDDGMVIHIDDVVEGEWLEKKTTNIKYGEPPRLTEAWMLELAAAASYAPGHTINLMVMHLMGDYGANRFPMLSGPWEYTFSDEEVAEAQRWFHERKRLLVEAMATGVAPSYTHRMGWECKECPLFGTLCDAAEMGEPAPLPAFVGG